MTRERLLAEIAAEVLAAAPARIARVAIDGVDGAGKTTFADELAEALAPSGRQVIRSSVDDFHRPRARRYARGRESPVGFFEDSYDYDTLARLLLDPLGPGGSRRFRRRAFDHRADSPVHAPEEVAAEDAILLLDGIFLHRDELAGRWDHSVFLHVPFAVSIPRGASRGEGSPDLAAHENRRYVEGQRLYLAACEPMRRATTVLDNTHLGAPVRLSADRMG